MTNSQYNPQYDKYESEFLDSVAAKFGLVGEYARLFKARVSRKFSDKYAKNTDLVKDREFLTMVAPEYKEDDFIWLSNQAENKLKDTLKKIKPKIKENNWTLDGNGKEIKSWTDLILFLQNEYFSQWWEDNHQLVDRNFWEELWNKVTSFTGIIIKPKMVPTLDLDSSVWGENEEEMPTFSWNSELSYEIKSQQKGYLTLIQKYASGKLYFFSPSCLVRQPYQPEQNHRFPSAKLLYLPLKAGIYGVDWVLAIVTETKPSFSWIKAEDDKPSELSERNLQEVLNFVNREVNCEVIGTKFRIIAPN